MAVGCKVWQSFEEDSVKKENVRIICVGYFEEELTNYNRIKEIMAQIEQGNILRPEFELVFANKKPTVYAAALFREGEPVFLEGWFVWHIFKGSPDNAVYCLKRIKVGEAGSKETLRCGAPEVIDCSAILSSADAAKLLESLAKGKPLPEFEQRSYRAIFGWGQAAN